MNPVHARLTRPLTVVAIAVLMVLGITGCAAGSGNAAPASVPTATPGPSAAPATTDGAGGPEADLGLLPDHPDVLVIGDSFTEGYGLGDPSHQWASIAARTLGWNATIDGVGGTGFTKDTATDGRAGLDYRARLASHASANIDYDLVVLQGGLNDSTAEPVVEGENVRGAVAAARGLWPEAVVLVFGPTEPTTGVNYSAQLPVIRASAVDAGAVFIDPAVPEPWINDENTPLFDLGDGLHLNDAGYVYLAARFVAAVESSLAD
jgi:lysophospholipase L1-like esterase